MHPRLARHRPRRARQRGRGRWRSSIDQRQRKNWPRLKNTSQGTGAHTPRHSLTRLGTEGAVYRLTVSRQIFECPPTGKSQTEEPLETAFVVTFDQSKTPGPSLSGVRPFAFSGVEINARELEIENGFTTIARRANSQEKIPALRDSCRREVGRGDRRTRQTDLNFPTLHS